MSTGFFSPSTSTQYTTYTYVHTCIIYTLNRMHQRDCGKSGTRHSITAVKCFDDALPTKGTNKQIENEQADSMCAFSARATLPNDTLAHTNTMSCMSFTLTWPTNDSTILCKFTQFNNCIFECVRSSSPK